MGCKNQTQQQQNLKEDAIKIRTKDENQKSRQLETKIVLLGDISVGKTSIASRYCKNTFNEHHINTIGGAYLQQKIVLSNGVSIKFHIWDTSGQERFRTMTNLYYHDAQAAILTYDVTNEDSMKSLDYWINELKGKVETDNMILILAGNKCDVSDNERKVDMRKGMQLAEKYGMTFFETSAKAGTGIIELFNEIGNRIYELKKLEK